MDDKNAKWASPEMMKNPWWRDGMSPEEYDKEREYYIGNFETIVKKGLYIPLWKQNQN